MEKSISLIIQFLKCIVLVLIFFGQSYAQVESTTTGGPWTSPSTWKDNVVPASGDNVLIKGPVTLDVITIANSIQITNTGELKPEVIQSYTYKLYVADYLWNNGYIYGWNLEIYIGGTIGGSIYNTANGNWDTGNLYVIDTLSHALLSEGIWFSPNQIRADSATLVSAGNIEIDSSTVYAGKFILGQNLQNEKLILDHGSVLRVKNFVSVGTTTPLKKTSTAAGTDTSGIEFKNGSYISSSPISGTATSYTDVIFKGDVGIRTNVNFYGNTILNGNMNPQFSNSYTITSNGLFQNNGEIKANNSGNKLSFDIWGDLINNGNWTSNTIMMMGTGNHIVSTDPNSTFNPSLFRALTSTVTVSTTPMTTNGITGSSFLRFDNSNVIIMKIILETGSSLNLVSNSSLAVQQLIGNGNEVKFINNSYLYSYSDLGNSSFENVNFTGNVGITNILIMRGNCFLNGNMYPQFSSTHASIASYGLFQNNGEISSERISFGIYGNLTNNGTWLSNVIWIYGGNHILEIDTNYSFTSSIFSLDSSVVTSNSDLRFDNSTIKIKTLILQNSNNLILNNSDLSGGISGNGNKIVMNNNSYLDNYSGFGNSSFENVNFAGNVGIDANLTFYGNCYNNGNMYPQTSFNPTITSSGLFQNNGQIKAINSGVKLSFDIYGDLENSGTWVSKAVSIMGYSNQHIGIADTSSFDKIKVYANHSGDSFQWMLDTSPIANGGDISGATSSIITINNFDSKYFGTIKCEIDSAGNSITSRDIIVNDIITDVKIDGGGNGDSGKDGNKNQIPKIFSLSQNYPNPFNPTTIIEYDIPAVETGYIPSVQLRIFDILGREVAVLVNEQQKPGYYKINFDASSLSSGIYFYRISVGKFVGIKKMILLK